jgi:Ion channel
MTAQSNQYNDSGLLLPLFTRLLRWLHDSNVLPGYLVRRRFGKAGLDIYVVGFVVALTILNWVPSPPAPLAWIVSVLFAYQLLNILVAALLIVFGATDDASAVTNPRHSLFLTLWNVIAIIMMFAVTDRWLATAWPNGVQFKSAQSSFDFLYMSWTNFTTLGNDFTPVTPGAQVLNIAEVTSSLVLLAVIVAAIVGSIRPTVRGGP